MGVSMIGDASVSRRRQLVQMNVGKVMIMIFCFLSLFIVDGAKKVRVKVQVSESVKFMIPIIPTATVGELLEICIARGEKHDLLKDRNQGMIELLLNGASLFHEDTIEDVIAQGDVVQVRWEDSVVEEVSVDAAGDQHGETELLMDGANATPIDDESSETYKVNVGRGLVVDVSVPEGGLVADVASATYTRVQEQLASDRTTIVELQIDGATLFPDDVVSKVIDPREVITVVWGFQYTIKASDKVRFDVALYHNSKVRNLVYAARNLALQHKELQGRRGAIVDLRLSHSGRQLMPDANDLVTSILSEKDEVLDAVWGTVYFVEPNLHQFETSEGFPSPDKTEPLVVGVAPDAYISTFIQNANLAISQNSKVYKFAQNHKIVGIQSADGTNLHDSDLVADAIRSGADDLYAIWDVVSEPETASRNKTRHIKKGRKTKKKRKKRKR